MNKSKRKTGNPRGRPLLGDKKLTERYVLRLRPDQRDKVNRLGGAAWVRAKIDEAD